MLVSLHLSKQSPFPDFYMFTLVQIVLYQSAWLGVLDELAGNVIGLVGFAIKVYFGERPLTLERGAAG